MARYSIRVRATTKEDRKYVPRKRKVYEVRKSGKLIVTAMTKRNAQEHISKLKKIGR